MNLLVCIQRNYYCNQSLFTQTQEQTLMTTSSYFQKRPLVETVKRKLMLHQETKLKHPQLKNFSHKITVSIKCQNLLVIQVSKDMICFSCYRPLVHLRAGWRGGGGGGGVVR